MKVTADDGTLTSAQVESNSLEVVVTGHDFGEWVVFFDGTFLPGGVGITVKDKGSFSGFSFDAFS